MNQRFIWKIVNLPIEASYISVRYKSGADKHTNETETERENERERVGGCGQVGRRRGVECACSANRYYVPAKAK